MIRDPLPLTLTPRSGTDDVRVQGRLDGEGSAVRLLGGTSDLSPAEARSVAQSLDRWAAWAERWRR